MDVIQNRRKELDSLKQILRSIKQSREKNKKQKKAQEGKDKGENMVAEVENVSFYRGLKELQNDDDYDDQLVDMAENSKYENILMVE